MFGTTLRNVVMGLSLVGLAASVGCAEPQEAEKRGVTTSKLLAPYKAVDTPASVTADFVKALGGVPIDINRWKGFIAGRIDTDDEDRALFALHFSGVNGEKPVAGITVAIVEDENASGDLQSRMENAAILEVRFNNGSGLVSRHSFVDGTSVSPHKNDPESDALLKRAFSDATAIINAPADVSKSSDKSKQCLANYLNLVQHAARCVNDAANVDDCDAVRVDAIATAAICNGTQTANILADADQDDVGEDVDTDTSRKLTVDLGGSIQPQFLDKIFGGLGGMFNIGNAGGLLGGGTPTAGTTGGLNFGSLLGSLGGLIPTGQNKTGVAGLPGMFTNIISGFFNKGGTGGNPLTAILPQLFKNLPSIANVLVSKQNGSPLASILGK